MFESFQKFYIIKEFNDFITKLVLKKVKIICINSIGFDKRGMKSLEILNQFSDRLDIEFLVIYIKENAYLHDNNIVTYLNENTIAADKLLISKKVLKFDLNPLDYLSFKNHVEINLINEINAFKPAWVLIDISALPRDYFFVLVRYFLESKMPNVKIAIINTEFFQIDYEPNRIEYKDPITLSGYHVATYSDPLESPRDLSIWIPILGKEIDPIQKIIDNFKSFPLTFPLLPFPCIFPHDSDDILLINKKFFDIGAFNYNNIVRIPYENPFEVAKEIGRLVEELRSIFQEQRVNLIFYSSPYGSKMQNLGLCIAAYNYDLNVLYSKPTTYELDKKLDNTIENPILSQCKIYILNL